MVFVSIVMAFALIAVVCSVAAFFALGGSVGQHSGSGLGATNAADLIARYKTEREEVPEGRLRRTLFQGVITDCDYYEYRLSTQQTVTIPAVRDYS